MMFRFGFETRVWTSKTWMLPKTQGSFVKMRIGTGAEFQGEFKVPAGPRLGIAELLVGDASMFPANLQRSIVLTTRCRRRDRRQRERQT